MRILKPWIREALDLLLPRHCILCDRSESEFEISHLCQTCMIHLYNPTPLAIPSFQENACSALSLGPYTATLRKLLHRAKFQARMAEIETLKDLSKKGLDQTCFEFDSITAVPGHFFRNLRRGIHLPGAIARHLAKKTGIPYDRKLLHRMRKIPHQTGLNSKMREKNVAGAYAAEPRAKKLRVLVVDDVFTSGSTAQAISSCLFDQEASEVRFLFLAHVPHPHMERKLP